MNRDDRNLRTVPPRADVLGLARSTSDQAREALRAYAPDELASVVATLGARDRAEFLELTERGPELVPLLPEAVFASAVLATGIEHAGWMLASATPEQRVAAIDLDCWQNDRPVPPRLFEWIDALIEAGSETLIAAFDELDMELWFLAFKQMADFSFLAPDLPPEIPTLDGFVGFDARSSEHEERLQQLLATAFSESPEHYWRFVFGAMNESQSQCAFEAAAWHRGRMAELGFPERGQAMRVYRPLQPETIALPPAAQGAASSALVATSRPPAMLDGTLIGQALVELPADRAAEVLADILGVANSLAVADELPLSEPESVNRSLQKALRGIERGVVELARRNSQSLAGILAEIDAVRLFRIGATLMGDLRPTKTLTELTQEENADDWAIPTETIEAEDQAIGESDRAERS